jgi:hypothetical protein
MKLLTAPNRFDIDQGQTVTSVFYASFCIQPSGLLMDEMM